MSFRGRRGRSTGKVLDFGPDGVEMRPGHFIVVEDEDGYCKLQEIDPAALNSQELRPDLRFIEAKRPRRIAGLITRLVELLLVRRTPS